MGPEVGCCRDEIHCMVVILIEHHRANVLAPLVLDLLDSHDEELHLLFNGHRLQTGVSHLGQALD